MATPTIPKVVGHEVTGHPGDRNSMMSPSNSVQSSGTSHHETRPRQRRSCDAGIGRPSGRDLFDHRHGWEQHAAISIIGPSSSSESRERAGSPGWPGRRYRRQRDGGRERPLPSPASSRTSRGQGCYSIAMGEAIFQASAQSASPGGAAAAADTFLDVSGADFIFEREVGGSKHGLHDAAACSELDYFAIDIHGWSPPHGPIVIELGGPPATISRLATTRPWRFRASHRNGRGARRQHPFGHAHQCADGREPLLVRECNGNGGALGARLNPAGKIRSLARKEIGVMSGSTNTFFAAMNSTAHAMGDLTATKTATAAAVLPGASIGYAAAVAVAQDTAPARPIRARRRRPA